MKMWILALAVLASFGAGPHWTPRYGVRVTADKKTDFTRLRSYVWSTTTDWSVYGSTVDRQIVAAVDRELEALGLTKRGAEPCDVIVSYATLRRTDTDLKSTQSPETQLHREYPVGTLVVSLVDPRTRRELFRGRLDAPWKTDPSELEAQIDTAVAQMFRKWPPGKSRRYRLPPRLAVTSSPGLATSAALLMALRQVPHGARVAPSQVGPRIVAVAGSGTAWIKGGGR